MSIDFNLSTNTAVIPFRFRYFPLRKLALINFEKDPDEYYIGFEPQYIEGEAEGTGYRIIAYRRDGYVDVYDEPQLSGGDDDSFDVTGKGLCERRQTEITNTAFEKKDGRIHISFQFTDKYGREVKASILEKTAKNSRGINLLAPIGSATEKPSYLPVFFLYDFDFVRKHKTVTDFTVDGKALKADSFPYPIPKDMQWRYYTRYSDDCQIIEFAKTEKEVLKEHTPDKNGKLHDGGIDFQFSDDRRLVEMSLNKSPHPFTAQFGNGIPDIRFTADGSEYDDTFVLSADPAMGSIKGRYSVARKGDEVQIELRPDGGWETVPDSRFTKIMFGKKSLFCSWPKTYRYVQTINLNTLESASKWERVEK